MNYRWIKTEKFFREINSTFFTVHHISATCHHFKVGQKKIKNSPEQKTRQTKWIDCTEFFFQKNIYSSFESKICFLWKKLEKRKKEGKIVKLIYHFISQVFFSIWKSDSLCIYKTLTTILITIFYQRMLHNATSFRISSLLVMKLELPEIQCIADRRSFYDLDRFRSLPIPNLGS